MGFEAIEQKGKPLPFGGISAGRGINRGTVYVFEELGLSYQKLHELTDMLGILWQERYYRLRLQVIGYELTTPAMGAWFGIVFVTKKDCRYYQECGELIKWKPKKGFTWKV